MPLQVSSCVYFTQGSEIVTLSGHLVFLYPIPSPFSFSFSALFYVSGCRPYGLHLLGFLLANEGPGRRSEGKRIHHFPPLPTWAPCAWQPWKVLSFQIPVPAPVSRSHPIPTVQLPSTQASGSYQPIDALSILVCPLTLIIPLCIATLLRNLYLYQFVYILFPPEL